MDKVHVANAALEKTLDANEAPACLRQADSELHTAASLVDQAMHNGTAGIDKSDAALILKMVDQVSQASTHLTRAGGLLEKNSC